MAQLLSPQQARSKLASVKGWRVAGGRVRRIQKRYTLDDFVKALRFVNKVGRLAEEAGHHPDIVVQYNRVTLKLSTHSAGGVTQADIALVKKIEAAAPRRPRRRPG